MTLNCKRLFLNLGPFFFFKLQLASEAFRHIHQESFGAVLARFANFQGRTKKPRTRTFAKPLASPLRSHGAPQRRAAGTGKAR